MLKHFIVTAVFALTTYTYANDSRLKLERVNVNKSENDCKTTEIVSIQEKTNRLALSCSDKGTVDILSIELPFKPTLLHSITISTQEEISSIAFHQSENIVAAAVLNNNPFEKGRIQIHRADNGEIINTLEAGIHPDGLAFSPNGEYLVVANEGEAYHYNGKNYESPNGSVTLINYTSANDARALQIELSDYSDVKGMLHKSIHELLNELLVEAIAMKKLMFQYKIIRLQIPNLSS